LDERIDEYQGIDWTLGAEVVHSCSILALPGIRVRKIAYE
jgi:hypothetical protein